LFYPNPKQRSKLLNNLKKEPGVLTPGSTFRILL